MPQQNPKRSNPGPNPGLNQGLNQGLNRGSPRDTSRRDFLKRTAAAGALTPLASLALGACATGMRYTTTPTLRHACVGVGGMGDADMTRIGSHPDVIISALCDVDRAILAKAAAKFPDARLYTDWRDMLETEAGRIDSVNVTTPDHMHAPVAMTALQRDLHVYCQKPLSHTVVEARRLAEAAAAAGVVTQMGIQNHSNLPFRKAHEIFQTGVTGPITEVHVWTDRPAGWWAQGVGRPEGVDPIPESLDWNGWLGVAPTRPYKLGAYHTFAWRGRIDFGTGAQGDMGCHLMDPVPWFLEVDAPTSVRSMGPPPTTDSFPEWSEVHYTFPAGNDSCDPDGVHVVWHDGARKPDELFAAWGIGDDVYANAALFVGPDAALLASPYEDCRVFGKDGEHDLILPELPEINHWHQYVEACFGREAARTPFRYAGPLTETALLGNIALAHPEVELPWDSRALRFPGHASADALLHKPYRRGWEVQGLDQA